MWAFFKGLENDWAVHVYAERNMIRSTYSEENQRLQERVAPAVATYDQTHLLIYPRVIPHCPMFSFYTILVWGRHFCCQYLLVLDIVIWVLH